MPKSFPFLASLIPFFLLGCGTADKPQAPANKGTNVAIKDEVLPEEVLISSLSVKGHLEKKTAVNETGSLVSLDGFARLKTVSADIALKTDTKKSRASFVFVAPTLGDCKLKSENFFLDIEARKLVFTLSGARDLCTGFVTDIRHSGLNLKLKDVHYQGKLIPEIEIQLLPFSDEEKEEVGDTE